MLLANNSSDSVRTSWPALRTTSPMDSRLGSESPGTEDDPRKPTKPPRPYRNSPSAPKKYLLVDQTEQQSRSAPLTKKKFLSRSDENDEALNVIFNPVFSLSDEYEQMERNNLFTDSPTPLRKTSFTDGSPTRGSRENSPRRWHSMPQEPKKLSPVLPNLAKHRLKSPGPSASQLSVSTNGSSERKHSEEGSVLSSDEEESTDTATAMSSSPKAVTVKRQTAVMKGRINLRRATVGIPEQKRKYSYDEKGTPAAARFKSKRSNSVCSFHPNGECPLGAGSGLEVLDVLCNRLDNILRDEAKNNVDVLTCRLDQNQIIADLQAKNRSLEEKNKLLEEKCEQFSKDGKQIQQHLSTLLKSYQVLEKRLSDVTAEKEAYINRLVTIYKSGKDISLDDEQTLKTPATPLQANGKSPSPSTKHFHTLPHPPKNKSQLKETSV